MWFTYCTRANKGRALYSKNIFWLILRANNRERPLFENYYFLPIFILRADYLCPHFKLLEQTRTWLTIINSLGRVNWLLFGNQREKRSMSVLNMVFVWSVFWNAGAFLGLWIYRCKFLWIWYLWTLLNVYIACNINDLL